jgi:hypothetical protein
MFWTVGSIASGGVNWQVDAGLGLRRSFERLKFVAESPKGSRRSFDSGVRKERAQLCSG